MKSWELRKGWASLLKQRVDHKLFGFSKFLLHSSKKVHKKIARRFWNNKTREKHTPTCIFIHPLSSGSPTTFFEKMQPYQSVTLRCIYYIEWLALMLAKLCSLVSIWKSFAAESLFSIPLVALAFELDPLQVSPNTGVCSITVVAMAAMQKFFQAPAHDST